MTDRKLMRTGITGSVIVAICCFTPVLAVLLSVLDLSAWLVWLDYVLLPTLMLFLGMIAYALLRRHQTDRGL